MPAFHLALPFTLLVALAPARAQEQVDAFEALATELVAHLQAGDAEAVDAAVDREAVLAAVVGGIGFPRMMLAEYRGERFPDFSIGGELRYELRDGARVRVVQTDTDSEAGTARAMLRVVRGEHLAYLTLDLARDAGGTVKLVDAAFARSGESLVRAERRAFVTTYAADRAGLVKDLPEPEKTWVRSHDTLESIERQLALGDAEAAQDGLRRLPLTIARERPVLVLALEIARARGDAEVETALANWREAWPGDLGPLLYALDQYRARGLVKELLATVGALEEVLGSDGFLAAVRGDVHLARENWRGARSAYLKAVEREPDLEIARWGLVDVALARKDYRSIPVLLAELEEHCGADLSALEARAGFEGFAATRHYARWRGEREGDGGGGGGR